MSHAFSSVAETLSSQHGQLHMMRRCLQWQRQATVKMTAFTCHLLLASPKFLWSVSYALKPTFTQSMMVSVAVSALGRTSIHFVDPGVKVNGKYYREVLMTRDLLLEIRQCSEYFIFQQDGAPAHRARETVEFLEKVTPNFIQPSLWPPNSPYLFSQC